MNTLLKSCLIFLVLATFTACGGGPEEESPPEESSDSDSGSGSGTNPPETNEPTESVERGKELYISTEQGCRSCHGDDGQSTAFKAINPTRQSYVHSSAPNTPFTLEDYISEWMPPSAAESCVEQCAIDIAAYIRTWEVGDPVRENDSDRDGITDDIDQCPNTKPEDIPSIDSDGCANSNTLVENYFAINAGGDAFTAADGITYVEDSDQYHSASRQTNTPLNSPIDNTNDDFLYQTERYTNANANMNYTIPVPDGNYHVVLKFSEVFHESVNSRKFDVSIEGQQVIDDLDLYAVNNQRFYAHDVVVNDIVVADSVMTIDFVSVINNAQISAIRIDKVSNDGDGDGIADNLDFCPGSDGTVDANGCTDEQNDLDGDGVPAALDLCPHTPADQLDSVPASGQFAGCSDEEQAVDEDGDGVSDIIDRCKDSLSGEQVGITGCSGIVPLEDKVGVVSPQSRLISREYQQTLKAAFSSDTLPGIVMVSDSRDGVFANNAGEQLGDYEPVLKMAEEYGEFFAQQLASTCDWGSNLNSCVSQQFGPIVEVLYRESATSADLQNIVTIISDLNQQGLTLEAALAAAIARTLVDQRFLFKLEYGDRPLSHVNQRKLTNKELASRLSYTLLDSPPDRQLTDAIDNLGAASVFQNQVERLIDEDNFEETIWLFVADWLGIPLNPPDDNNSSPPPLMGDQCNLTSECRTAFPNLAQVYDCVDSGSTQSYCSCDGQRCDSLVIGTMSLERSMHEETRRFVNYIAEGNAPFTDLFTANYSFVNSTLANHYGIPAPATDWEMITFPASANRRGILTHASFLTAYGEEKDDVSWIFRGKAVYERLFCEVLPNPPDNAADTVVESRETTSPCASCHRIVDPIGRIFDGYDEHGALKTNGLTNGALSIGVDVDGSYANPMVFANALPDSKALTHCVTKMWYRYALGRKAFLVDSDSFVATREALENTNSLTEMVKAFTKTDSFSSVYAQPAQSQNKE